MHPEMLADNVENEIDSVDQKPVENPYWCPLLKEEPQSVLKTKHEIEGFVKEVRSKLMKTMNVLCDGDPNYLLTDDAKFEMILEEGQKEEIVKFAQDVMDGRLDEHYSFFLMYCDDKPGMVIFEIIPRHVRASTIMQVAFPKNLKSA